MKAIFLNTVDVLMYNLYVRTFNLLGWLAIYKVWILASIILFGSVLLAGSAFGWEKLAE